MIQSVQLDSVIDSRFEQAAEAIADLHSAIFGLTMNLGVAIQLQANNAPAHLLDVYEVAIAEKALAVVQDAMKLAAIYPGKAQS